TDAPDPVDRARFRQHGITGVQQPFPKLRMLAELRGVAAHCNLEPMRHPALFVKAPYPAPEAFGLRGTWCGENGGERFLVSEEFGLPSHHVVFGARICAAADREPCRPPLAEHVLSDPLILGSVPPKQ